MEYYSLIYCNEQGDCVYSIVKAESHFDAEDKAKTDVKQYLDFHVYSVNWLDKNRIENGEVCILRRLNKLDFLAGQKFNLKFFRNT